MEEELTALRVEAAAIDLLGKDQLTNSVRGSSSGVFGRIELQRLMAQFNKEKVNVEEPALLIRLTDSFRYEMSEVELYDAGRGTWKIGERRNKVKYVLAVHDGVVQEVYHVATWLTAGSTLFSRGMLDDSPGRWEFVGHKAPEEIRNKYNNHSVEHLFPQSAQNPIKYVNV